MVDVATVERDVAAGVGAGAVHRPQRPPLRPVRDPSLASAVQHLTGAVEHDRHDRRLTRQTAHRLGWQRDPVGGLTQRVLVQTVEHRVVVDVDTDLRHPPLTGPLPRHRATRPRRPAAHRSGCRRCRRACLIDASWASIADHSLASRSGSRRRWVWCMPEGLSTQRRTDTDAFCLSSSDSPSSPAKRLPSSRQRRSNTATGSTRANPNRSSCNPPSRSRPASSSPLAALATASTWPADTTPVGEGVLRSRASARTPRNDPTPPGSHVSSAARNRSTPPPPTRSGPQQPTPRRGGRSPHRRHRPSPAPAAPTSPHRSDRPDHTPRRRPPTARRSPRRHHDLPSPTPLDHNDQPGGSRMRTTLNRGCHNEP